MAIRDIKVTLNLDTGKFVLSARDADGAMKNLSKSMTESSKALAEISRAFTGSISSARQYVKEFDRITTTKNQLRTAQARYIKSLVEELDTLGMTTEELRRYEAAQLGIITKSQSLRDAIAKKSAALEQSAELLRMEQKAAEDNIQAYLQKEQAGIDLIKTLEDEITVLQGGTDALLAQRAAELDVAEAVQELILQKNKLVEAEQLRTNSVKEAISPEEALRAELQRQITTMREAIIVRDEGKVGLARYKVEAIGATEALAGLVAELGLLEEELVPVTLEMDGLSHATHGSTGAIVELNRIMHEASRGAFTQMTGSITILLNRLGAAGGLTLAVGVAIGLLHAMIKPALDAAKATEELARQSEMLGISIKDMQTYGVLSELTGTKLDKLTQATTRLDAAFARAKQGSKATATAFKQLGIDLNGDFSNKQLLEKVANSFSKIKSSVVKAEVAQRLFGRAGKELIPILNQGAEGFRKADGLIQKYGIHNQEAVNAALALSAAQNENKIAMQGLGEIMMQSLGPILKSITVGFTDLIGAFIKSYQSGGMVKSMMTGLDVIIKIVIEIVTGLGLVFYNLFSVMYEGYLLIKGMGMEAWAGLEYIIGLATGTANQFMKVMGDISRHDWSAALSDTKNFFAASADAAKKASEDALKTAEGFYASAEDTVKNRKKNSRAGEQFMVDLWKNKTRNAPSFLSAPDQSENGGTGDIPGNTGAGKKNPAETYLNHLGESIAEFKAKEADLGTEHAKLEYMLKNTKGFAEAAAQIKGGVKALEDEANAYDAAKKSLEEYTKAKHSLEKLETKSDDAKATSNQLWADYLSGVTKADRAIINLRQSLQSLVDDQTTPEAKQKAQGLADGIIKNTERSNSEKALETMSAETKRINADLMTDSIAKAKAVEQEKITQAYNEIKWASLSSEEAKKAYSDYVDFVKAKNKELQANTAWGKMARDWSSTTDNMRNASAKWMQDFSTQLSQGKLNFKDFSASVIQDIAQIMIQAVLAKYVVDPLLTAFNLGGTGMSVPMPATVSAAPSAASTVVSSLMSALVAHTGAIVGAETPSSRMISPSVFTNAYKYHTGGIAGLAPNEVPTILQKNEGVFTKEQMKAMGGSSGSSGKAPPVQINLNNQSGTQLDADHSGTHFDGEKYIMNVVVSNLNRPGSFRNAVRQSK